MLTARERERERKREREREKEERERERERERRGVVVWGVGDLKRSYIVLAHSSVFC